MMNTYKIRAYAKINLGLDVIGVMPNGYHQVRMIMQTVDIWDELTLERTDEGIVLMTDSSEIPTDGDNLICKAVKCMQDELGIQGGVKIRLHKNIPIAAGMAGGSADAAAAMKGMNELYGLGLSMQKLMELGVRIGADVPYCIMGGTALAEGIGEKLSRLPAPPECVLVVAKPDMDISTKLIYERLDSLTEYAHPDIDGMIDAIKNGNLAGIVSGMGNVLEPVTSGICPAIREIRSVLEQNGAIGSLMSGSGPSVFGIFEDRIKAEAAAAKLRERSDLMVKQSFVTEFVQTDE